MKWKLLLCVAAAAVVSGCEQQPSAYATYGEFGFTYDLTPEPVPGLTISEAQRIAEIPGNMTVTQIFPVPPATTPMPVQTTTAPAPVPKP